MKKVMIGFISILITAGLGLANVPLGDWSGVVEPGIDATGGPDDYGYTWIDSNEPGGPVYNWIDISGIGTLVTGLGDDNWVGPFNIGFPFHYYWYDVTQYYIGSNGYIKFGSPYNIAQPFPNSIPLNSTPNDFLAVYIADWWPGQPGVTDAVYRWTNNVDTLIVSFEGIHPWVGTGVIDGPHSFQVILTDTDSSITFQYGYQEGTVSNDDILIGIENNNGQVGLEHSHDAYVTSDYAVLFEYPDEVTYVVHDMATIASANENSEGFFVVNGDAVTPWARVKNTGNQTENNIGVFCQIMQEGGGSVYNQSTIVGPLAPGEELEVTFTPNWTPAANGQYFVKCQVVLAGDMNPNNDDKTTECHVLNIPGVLLYDDGTSEQAWSWMGGNGGLGQRFVPPTYPVRIDDIRYFITSVSTLPTFTATIYDEVGGAPGNELFTTTVNVSAANQWYTVDVSAQNIVIDDGAYYVAWHMTGDNSTSLGTDNSAGQIGSRQSWEFTGVWAPFRNAETHDVMIRTQISEPGAVPDVTVTLTPYGTPIQIPASGGSFDFNIAVANNEGTAQTFDVWTDATLPNGSIFGPIIGPINVTLPGGVSPNRDRTQSVPGGAPPGTYSYNAYVGIHPSTVWDSDSFNFEKLTVGDGTLVTSWANYGEGFESWMNSSAVEVPSEFALISAHPNPFNPTTTIGYALPEAARVTLSVYDVNGRLVARLVDGWRDAGVHEAVFDASGLASGMYLYCLSAGDFTAVQKMILIK